VLTYKAFRYRIYPTPAQEARLEAWDSALRWLWNLANEHRLLGMSMSRKRYPTAFDQINSLKELRSELLWLADVPRDVAANLLIELDRSWQRCFKRLARAPRWKRKGRDFLSMAVSCSKVRRIEGSFLRFPKLGSLRVVAHRPLEGTPKTCTLKRDGDQWFVSIVCAIESPAPIPRTAPVVAIDRGVIFVLADSDGKLTPNPKFHASSMKCLARAQRVASRRKKGSKNREKGKAPCHATSPKGATATGAFSTR